MLAYVIKKRVIPKPLVKDLKLKKIRNTTHAVFLYMLGFIILSGHALALEVNEVRFGMHPDKIRLVLELDQPQDYRVFTLPNPYRIVIDLPTFHWRAGQVKPSRQTGITDIRHGNLKPGISRIVFDVLHPTALKSAFLIPGTGTKPNRLVIDFAHTSPTQYERVKSTVLGSLNVNNPQQGIITSSYTTPPPIPEQNNTYIPTPPPKPPEQNHYEKPLIIIDPGHGGVDPGAIAHNGTFEKHIVLKLAKTLKEVLENSGQYRVRMTRENDVFVKLKDRVEFARKNKGDLFVSIHADSIQKPHVRGASIYTLSEKASDAQSARLAAQENRADLIAGIDLSIEDDEVASILVDLAMRDTMNQSKFFANRIVESFAVQNVKTLSNPQRSAGFAVLKAPDMPSVLIEAGFLSNRTEARMLNTPAHRKKIAEALKKGIDAYFEQVRKNQKI